MALSVQPDKIGLVLTKLHTQLIEAPTDSRLRDLAVQTLTNLESYKSSWEEAQIGEFYAKYSPVVEGLTTLTAAPDPVVELKGVGEPIQWKKGAEWPVHSYLQPHPEFNLLQVVAEINKAYDEYCGIIGTTEDMIYEHDWDTGPETNSKYNSKQFYNVCRLCTQGLPPESAGFVRALKYVQSFMGDKTLASFRKEQILSLIREVQTHLVGQKTPYRRNDSFIFNTAKVNKDKASFAALDKYFSDLKDSCPADFALWKTTRAKLWNHKYKKALQEPLIMTHTETDLWVRHGIGRIPPSRDQIPTLMTLFAEELSKKFKTAEDPYALMAWAHKEYVHIHPYNDANGRGARILMSLIGIQAGINPVIFDSELSYESAVTAPDVQKFRDYLSRLHEEQTRAPLFNLFINKALASMVKDTE